MLFVNGLPLAVIELKNPADENATIWTSYQQLQTYQAQIPSLFATNAALIAFDGVQARIGTLGAGKEWFKPWRTIRGDDFYAAPSPGAMRHPLPLGEGRGEGPRSLRRNIVVIADEAHRSQYDFIDGFARHMRDALPNASFIGFTGTPIEVTDKNTRAVFGDYISVYDIQRAVTDHATVPIYYESRLAKLELKASERPKARRSSARRSSRAAAFSTALTGRGGPLESRRIASRCYPLRKSTFSPSKTASLDFYAR